MNKKCPKCGAALKSHLPDDHWQWECETGFYLPSRTLIESLDCLRRQLAAERAAREKAEAERDEVRAACAEWASAIARLRRLEAAVEDDGLAKSMGRGHWLVDAYRAALREAAKEASQ